MRVLYRPQHESGAVGWFIGDTVVRLVPGVEIDVDDHIWQRLEREPGMATLIESGEVLLVG